MREKAKNGMEVDSGPPEAASLGTLKRDDDTFPDDQTTEEEPEWTALGRPLNLYFIVRDPLMS